MERVYGIYENGELIFRGTAKQISDKYYVVRSTIYISEKYDKDFLGIYKVRALGNSYKNREKKKSEPKMTKQQKYIEYLALHLKIYGNTVSATRPNTATIDALAKKGYRIDIKEYPHGKETDYILIAR